ncbi:MAG: hemolysin family protein [Pirellulaceae bacterium]
MNANWLGMLMCVCWALTLLGGLGVHVLENFNGRKLEAYCRLKRKPSRFGEILDHQARAYASAQYVLLFALVLGSLAAGAWFCNSGDVQQQNGILFSNVPPFRILGWVTSWLVLLVLAGLWLPRIVVRYSSSLFLYHSWPIWKGLAVAISPFSGLGEVFTWLGQRLSDTPDDDDFEEEMLEDEIHTMVQAGQRDGVFSEGVPDMIRGVMQLDDADVEEIMTPRSRVDAINIDQPWDEVVKFVAHCGRTRLPVYRGTHDNVIGILFVKDLLSVLADPSKGPQDPQTLESILRNPWFIPASKPVDQLLQIFLHNRNHMAIVVDEYQQFIGVVTIEDALEEIVGEIADELDIEEDSEIVYDERTHQVEAEGKVPIESIEKILGIELPASDDYDTVGGLIIHRLAEIPKVGTEVELNGVRITVLKATRRLVQRVRLELIGEDGTATALDS